MKGEIKEASGSLRGTQLAEKVRKLEVVWSIGDLHGLADWAAFEAGIEKGLEAAAKLIEKQVERPQDCKSRGMKSFLRGFGDYAAGMGEEWRASHPELMDSYQAAVEAFENTYLVSAMVEQRGTIGHRARLVQASSKGLAVGTSLEMWQAEGWSVIGYDAAHCVNPYGESE